MKYSIMILAVFLLMLGGVSEAAEDSLTVKVEFLERAGPEILEVSKIEVLENKKPVFVEVSKVEFLAKEDPSFLVPYLSKGGLRIWSANRDNKEYLRCAKLKGFNDQHKCALEGLGITPEEVDKSAGP